MAIAINDRTAEFRLIVNETKRRQNTKPGSQRLLSDSQKRDANGDGQPRRSEFTRKAGEVSRGIWATMGKLEKLAQRMLFLRGSPFYWDDKAKWF